MAKNEMKIIGVVIMIVTILSFAQANNDHLFAQVESNNSDGLTCKIKCDLKCIGYQPTPPLYAKCKDDCLKNCHDTSTNVIYN